MGPARRSKPPEQSGPAAKGGGGGPAVPAKCASNPTRGGGDARVFLPTPGPMCPEMTQSRAPGSASCPQTFAPAPRDGAARGRETDDNRCRQADPRRHLLARSKRDKENWNMNLRKSVGRKAEAGALRPARGGGVSGAPRLEGSRAIYVDIGLHKSGPTQHLTLRSSQGIKDCGDWPGARRRGARSGGPTGRAVRFGSWEGRGGAITRRQGRRPFQAAGFVEGLGGTAAAEKESTGSGAGAAARRRPATFTDVGMADQGPLTS